jgi:hypothetical protein
MNYTRVRGLARWVFTLRIGPEASTLLFAEHYKPAHQEVRVLGFRA